MVVLTSFFHSLLSVHLMKMETGWSWTAMLDACRIERSGWHILVPYEIRERGEVGMYVDRETPDLEQTLATPVDPSMSQQEGAVAEGVPQWTSPYIKPMHLITDIDSQHLDSQDPSSEEDV